MTGSQITRVTVRTPEGVVFTFPLAGPVVRSLAMFVDLTAITAIISMLEYVLGFLFVVTPDVANAIYIVGAFGVSFGYGILFEWLWRGQTPGKKLFRLRVVDEEGLPLTASQVVMRNLLRAIDALPLFYLVGGVVMMLNARAQRLGDIAAGTIVIRHRRAPEPDFGQILEAGRYNSLREHAHLAARLRQQVVPDLAAAATEALLRRDELEPDARVALFAELAATFRRLVPYPHGTAAEMPDETYVRNVVEIVHASTAPRGRSPAEIAETNIVSA